MRQASAAPVEGFERTRKLRRMRSRQVRGRALAIVSDAEALRDGIHLTVDMRFAIGLVSSFRRLNPLLLSPISPPYSLVLAFFPFSFLLYMPLPSSPFSTLPPLSSSHSSPSPSPSFPPLQPPTPLPLSLSILTTRLALSSLLVLYLHPPHSHLPPLPLPSATPLLPPLTLRSSYPS